jgi:hypothetical protein
MGETMTDLMEKVAQTLFLREYKGYGRLWEDYPSLHNQWIAAARATLAAIEDAGWAVVPLEPTREMGSAAPDLYAALAWEVSQREGEYACGDGFLMNEPCDCAFHKCHRDSVAALAKARGER